MGFFYLGDSERIRAPCTNNAQVKFTTRKNILRLRKNNLRGSLGRETEQLLQNSLNHFTAFDFCQGNKRILFLWPCFRSIFKALENSRLKEKSKETSKGYTYLYLVSSGENLVLALNMT